MWKLLLLWIIFCAVVFVATGGATDFSTIDIQLHDTYFVIPLAHLFLAIGILGIMFLGLDWLSRSNKVFTLVVFLLNSMLFVVFASATVFAWRQSIRTSRMYPSYFGDPSMKAMVAPFLAAMITIAVLQMVLAIRALWRIRKFPG
jgi:heme/copper-type cytochrome/quinol oxidase subunit 1